MGEGEREGRLARAHRSEAPSASAALQSAILTSILTTARKRGQNFYEALPALAAPSPLLAPSMVR